MSDAPQVAVSASRVGENTTSPTRRGRNRAIRQETWYGVAFVAPLVIYLLVFYLYPLIRNVDLSVHDYTIIAFVRGDAQFVGFANHLAVLRSPVFGQALTNTLLFTVGSIVVQFSIGLALAVFFKQHFPLSGVLRGLFLIPWLLPLIVSGSIWAWMMNSNYGVINAFLSLFGVQPVNWLTSPHLALMSVTIANIWLGIPFNLVILYSGLQNISDDVYEAAEIDGANRW